MATIEKPPTTPQTEQIEAARPAPQPARPVIRPPKPFFLRSWFAFVVFIILVAAHVWGWGVAEIRPELLVQKAPNIQRFFFELLRPDIVTFDQARLQLSVSVLGSTTPVDNPQPNQASAELTPEVNSDQPGAAPVETATYNATLSVSSGVVAPDQEITVTGTGFRPNTPGRLLWQSYGQSASVQAIGEFTTDGQGSFTTKVKVPADPERVVNLTGFPNNLAAVQEWNIGGMKLSSTVGLVVDKIIETILLALMGTTFAVVLSIPLSFLAARNLMAHSLIGTAIYGVARTVLNVLRSIEVLILAVIFGATVGFGPFAGVLALSLHSIASLGKLYSEAIEAIDPGPIEAITATGANRLQVIMYAVVPQFIPQFISFTLYRWDINVRMSTVLGFVGGGGIGFLVQQYIQLLQWNQAATAIWAIALVVIAMDYASAKIRAAVI
jgi:phosphonate transport system permease protein